MIRNLLIILILSLISVKTYSQNSKEEFGKNKIQYSDDQHDWWIYETTNIVYYWYGKSRKVAEFYIAITEIENRKIQEIFEFHLKDKIELVVYSDHSDLYQTNLDLDLYLTPDNWNEEPKIIDQKILLYFDGNHQNSLKNLRKGLVKMYFNSIFSGSQIEEVVQKVISYKLPSWFESGLNEYLSESWNETDLLILKNYWKKKTNFKKINNRNGKLAGKSMWNYIVHQYGQQAISNWLYMIRIQKDINSAARLVFQRNIRNLYEEWFDFYSRELSNVNIEHPKFNKLKLRSEEQIIDLEPLDKTKYLLSTNQNSRKRVRILDIRNNKLKTIYKSGHRNKITSSESNYPHFFILRNSRQLGILDLIRNRNRIILYNDHLKPLMNVLLPEDFQEVYDIEGFDEKNIFLSANINGLSDLFKYNIITRSYSRITDDIYDELKIKYSSKDQKYIINSARPEFYKNTKTIDSIVPVFPFKLFSLDSNKLKEIENQFVQGSVEDFQIQPHEKTAHIRRNNKIDFFIKKPEGLFHIKEAYLKKIAINQSDKILKVYQKPNQRYYFTESSDLTHFEQILLNNSDSAIINTYRDSINSSEELIKNYFESEFSDPDNVEKVIQDFLRKTHSFQLIDLKNTEVSYQPKEHIVKFNSNQSIAYRNRFSMEDWNTTLNNELLFGGLNTFTGNNPVFDVPYTGILIKTKVKENFNNYFFDFGIRIPTNFRGTEAFVVYTLLKYRWDHSFAFYRKSYRNTTLSRLNQEQHEVTKTLLLNYTLRYALDHFQSFRLNNTIRNDHLYFKATDKNLIDSNGIHFQSIGSRVEYVFDDALNLSLNLKEGTQAKFFFELNKRFSGNFNDGIKLNALPGMLFVIGADIRHHIPILRLSTFSTRLYLNSSFGKQRILNHLGGTENWMIFRKYNFEQPPDLKGNYSFSQQVTEVRGHPISSRKGSSALVFSSEIRIPFFHYLLYQNWKNSFLRNMQLIPFLDIGLSWQGAIPNFLEIEKFSYYAKNPAVEIDVIYKRNPFIAGTGIGLRTSIFSYFIRFDYGWPIQELRFGKPITHISLGLDF